MSKAKKTWQLRGLKIHSSCWLPVISDNRRETIEKTLDVYASDSEDSFYTPRTTHLFKSDQETLKEILSFVEKDPDFTSASIVHSSSDLGLTHKLVIVHKNGSELNFDGLHLRITKTLSSDEFNLDELLSRTGVPPADWEMIHSFEECVSKAFPKNRVSSIASYYTIDETNWKEIGLRREGEPQLCVAINDPNYVTITASTFFERGKYFQVYLGEEEQIHAMIAQDFFIRHEVDEFFNYYNEKSRKLLEYQSKLKTDFGGIISPIWRIDKKHNKWNSLKETMKSVYTIQDLIMKGKKFTSCLRKTVDKNYAFRNVPRTLWIVGEEQDFEEKTPWAVNNFFNFRLENSKLEKVPDSDQYPNYNWSFERLVNTINEVSNQAEKIYERERDLLTGFQTEFSLYAVWLALIALAVALIALFF